MRLIHSVLNAKEKIAYTTSSFLSSIIPSFKVKRALILSSPGNSHGLCFPFHYYRMDLFKRFHFIFKEIISDDVSVKKREVASFCGDMIFVSVPLRKEGKIFSKKEAEEFMSTLRGMTKAKIIFFDNSDNPISAYFSVLPYTDLFLMPFTFRDPEKYFKKFAGGNELADFASKQFNLPPIPQNEYYDELFGSHPDKDQIDKIMPSWNWLLWRRMIKLFKTRRGKKISPVSRTIDILARFEFYTGWCAYNRTSVYEKLSALSSRYAIALSREKVSYKKYCEELEQAKITISPFGYGEICAKDFEAMINGSLLLKPSVEHVRTFPELHVPYETYVPVAWDLSDLEDKIEEYIGNDEKRRLIAAEAEKVHKEFFDNKGFLNKIEEIFHRLGISKVI